MALRIVKETDPIQVTRLSLCIYAPPGLGKTSLGFTADDPLLLDFDHGAYRSANRKDSVKVNVWDDICEMGEKELEPYKTIVVDTAGRALDILTADIISRDSKHGRGGTLSIQGYGVLKSRFIGWMHMVEQLGKDVVLIAHSEEQRKGEDTVERLDVQGGSKSEIYKTSAAMARISLKDDKRLLDFSPRECGFGKNPAQLPVLEIPHFAQEPNFLGNVIRQIKGALNEMTEGQRQAVLVQEEWKAKVVSAKDDSLTDLVKDINQSDCSDSIKGAVKGFINDKAKAAGLAWDKKTSAFKKAA
jgi:hypothetical protein